MIKTVNVRALKDKLSSYLRLVERGDVVLVSDRGTVIAELRRPTLHQAAIDAVQGRLQQLADSGAVRLGLPNRPEAYRSADSHLSAACIDEALAATRRDKS